MPAPAIPSNVLVADLCCDAGNKILRSRTYWSSDTAPENETHLTSIADAVFATFKPAYIAMMSDNYYFSRVECRWYGAGNTMFFANSSDGAAVGLIGSVNKPADGDEDSLASEDDMPLDNALVVQKKTGLRGRSNQGRLFIAGLSEKSFWRGELNQLFYVKAKALAAKVNTDINVANGGYNTTLHARHWNRKENVMRPITKVYVVKVVGSRMDRRPRGLYERV
jgi:hypothetical protein